MFISSTNCIIISQGSATVAYGMPCVRRKNSVFFSYMLKNFGIYLVYIPFKNFTNQSYQTQVKATAIGSDRFYKAFSLSLSFLPGFLYFALLLFALNPLCITILVHMRMLFFGLSFPIMASKI